MFTVHVIIPKGCYQSSIEITYEVAEAIEQIQVRKLRRVYAPNRCVSIEENGRESMCVVFETQDVEVINATIDAVLHAFAYSRWQQDAEKTVAMFDKANMRKMISSKRRRLIRYEYRAVAQIDE